MKILTRRVYDTTSPEEGYRVLVDRLWPRGITKNTLRADAWLKDIAPSNELRKWFNHDPAKWQEFRQRYHAELDRQPETVRKLLDEADHRLLILLYSARDNQHNQAVALKDYLLSCSRENS